MYGIYQEVQNLTRHQAAKLSITLFCYENNRSPGLFTVATMDNFDM